MKYISETTFPNTATDIMLSHGYNKATVSMATRSALTKIATALKDVFSSEVDIEELMNNDSFLEIIKQELIKKPVTQKVEEAFSKRTGDFVCPICLLHKKNTRRNMFHIDNCRKYYETRPEALAKLHLKRGGI